MKTTVCSMTLLVAILAASGCASVAVTGSAIEQRTAVALGVAPTDITISNRSDSGIRTDYVATTSQKKVYNCYVTGTVSVVGRTVSDAMCTPVAAAVEQPTAKTAAATAAPAKASTQKPSSASPSCNALLKAAGKC